MSVKPGATLTKDPNASLVYSFDWSAWLTGGSPGAAISSQTLTISGPDAALTKDNESIVDGTSVQFRLLGGTLGKVYKVTCRVVTDESPAQTEDATVQVHIQSN